MCVFGIVSVLRRESLRVRDYILHLNTFKLYERFMRILELEQEIHTITAANNELASNTAASARRECCQCNECIQK